jgi:hypothetical protein
MNMQIMRLVPLLALALAACGGNYSGTPVAGGSAGQNGNAGGTGSYASVQDYFKAQVEPNLGFCRTCHIPGGVADTAGTGPATQGNLFLLSSDSSQDYAGVMNAWTALGKGVDANKLLTNPSDPAQAHTGGQPWPLTSQAYAAMKTVLACWSDPSSCNLSGAGQVAQAQPLLGSARGGHLWGSYCANNGSPLPDSAVLPADPRSLVVSGANQGKAVYFNAYWRECHADPALVGEPGPPKTCGDWRASVARGQTLLLGNGAPGTGSFFAGNSATGVMTVTAAQYNNLWQLWGLSSRPANFDELVAQRYGLGTSPVRNPYPLPGEDPNASNGGSGQLPISATQTRNADGSWSGNIGLMCNGCHSTSIGSAGDGTGPGVLYGAGNSLVDTGLTGRDFGTEALNPIALFSLFGKSRGTNNASDVNLFYLVNQQAGLRLDASTLGVLTSGSTASDDTPAWWNVGHRVAKFQDGILPGDSVRTDLIFYYPFDGLFGSGSASAKAFMQGHDVDADHWIMSLQSPSWPYGICSNADGTPAAGDNPACVNRPLAEQGAILFHSKNLWAAGLNNPVPRPDGGNGSCASCHGAYSPRYVNDSTYLDTPALEGIAAYVVPKAVIGTDPARVDTNTQAVQQMGTTSYLNYPELDGTGAYCGPQNLNAQDGNRPAGYLAPPLYGIWATAPYFHNGSVPNVWEVLKPADRPPLWQRALTPAPAGQEGAVVMGFDTSMPRAYDAARLGWKYSEPACGSGSQAIPYLQCNPGDPDTTPAFQTLLSLLDGNLVGVWNVSNWGTWTAVTPAQIEQRDTYNTHLFSQGNQGHEFTAVLTDDERKALIEYLKTL